MFMLGPLIQLLSRILTVMVFLILLQIIAQLFRIRIKQIPMEILKVTLVIQTTTMMA